MVGYNEPSGEKSTSQGAEGHYGDSELAAGRQQVRAHFALDIKRPRIVFNLNSCDRAHGQTATKSLRRTFAKSDMFNLSLSV